VIEPSWSFAGRGGRRCGESKLFSPMIRSTRVRLTHHTFDWIYFDSLYSLDSRIPF
jgi:hypothetical protein